MSYILIFTKQFDIVVIENSDCPDKSNTEFIDIVKVKHNDCVIMLNRFPSLQSASTLFTFNDTNYKVTVNV